MIAVIDYNAGNIRSVLYALDRLKADYILTADEAQINAADKVIFPGVGAAGSAMAHLRKTGLDQVIKGLKQPTLGVCVGMQLMCAHSEENDTECLGIFDLNVKLFQPKNGEKVPHMGWNTIQLAQEQNWLSPELDGEYVYYVHSYFVEPNAYSSAQTDYCGSFCAMMHKHNFYAAQFHPEKSAAAGEMVLNNFLNIL